MAFPPGPQLPATLQTLKIVAQPIQFLEQCAQRYGDIFALQVLGPQSPPVIFCSDSTSLEAIFTDLSPELELGKVTHVFRPLVGLQSLIMQEGERHQHQRQLLMPALHGEHLRRQADLICELTQRQIASWQPGTSIPVRQQMAEISLQVILQVVFGMVPGENYRRLQVLLTNLLEAITSPLYSTQFFFPVLQRNWGPRSPWGQFLEQQNQIDALIAAEITARRQQADHNPSGNRPDILSMLLCARDLDGQPLGDSEIRDQLMTLLLLGHETTASGLTWAFYWLHRHPECLEKLRQELATIGQPDTNPLAAQLTNLPYLGAVCKEALRVYPIALIAQPRRTKAALKIAGFELPAGSILVPCIYLAHRRAATYAQPEQFRPERFLNQKFSPAEYLPFGGGNRSCIGMALSLLEMKLVLGTVLGQYGFSSNLSAPIQPTRRGITFVPPESFRLKVERKIMPISPGSYATSTG